MIPSYFLQKDYDILKPTCLNCPIECLHTKREEIIPLSKKITACYRAFPMLYEHDEYFWNQVIGFGNINEDVSDLKEGKIEIEQFTE